jgi:hypothetical protein
MTFRSLVASLCAVCCIGSVLAPLEASARGGGPSIGRGLVLRGAVLRPALRPSFHIGRPSFHIGRGPALVTRGAVVPNIQPAYVAPVQRSRRVFGARLPRHGIGITYGSIYDAGDVIGVAGQLPPVQTVADLPPLREGDRVAAIGRRCSSQTVVVPSEAGGERPITVTSCRSQ